MLIERHDKIENSFSNIATNSSSCVYVDVDVAASLAPYSPNIVMHSSHMYVSHEAFDFTQVLLT